MFDTDEAYIDGVMENFGAQPAGYFEVIVPWEHFAELWDFIGGDAEPAAPSPAAAPAAAPASFEVPSGLAALFDRYFRDTNQDGVLDRG